jgi:hypothetical protein
LLIKLRALGSATFLVYQVPLRFTGKLNKVTIRGQPRAEAPAEEAMLQRKGQRSNRASE